MKIKNLVTALLASALVVGAMTVSAMADSFEIATVTELQAFASAVNAGDDYAGDTVTLTADIDLKDVEWTPIGTGARNSASYTGNAFKGTFDGNDKTISNLTIEDTQSGDAVCGFFGTVSGGTVKDLNFVNASITSNATNTAVAVGLACDGATISGITVGTKKDNSVVNCPDGAAGVLGRLCGSGTITECVNYADVISTSTGGGVGGVVGKAYRPDSADSMEISECVNYGDVECGYAAGGIVGLSATNVVGCENYGDVTSGAEAGGIIGEQNNPTSGALYITGNKNMGKVTVTNPEKFGAGGIIGQAKTQATNPVVILYINDNENGGDILVEGISTNANKTDAGGIVGYLYMTDAIVSGNTNYAENIVAAGYAGGIVGLAYQHTDGNTTGDDVTIVNNINSTNGVGAVGSSNSANHEISNNEATEWSAVVTSGGVETKYSTLAYAVEMSKDGDTITLLADLEVDETVVITKDITIDGNGYTISGKSFAQVATKDDEAVTPVIVDGATVVFENITLVGGSTANNYEYQQLGSWGIAGDALRVINKANVTVNGSTLKGGNTDASWTRSGGSAIVVKDSVISVYDSVLANGRIADSTCIGEAVIEADLVSEITLKDVTLDAVKTSYSSDIIDVYSDSGDSDGQPDVEVNMSGIIFVPNNKLSGVVIVVPEGESVSFRGNVDASYIADTITVKYVKKDVDDKNEDNDEEADLYDIVLEGDAQFINRLTTADLTFALTSATAVKPVYEILPVEPVTITTDADYENRYMFNFDGVTQPDETAKEIVIGQVKISGYGAYEFGVAKADTNLVNATKTNDSIVENFIPGGAAGKGVLVIDATIKDEIVVPTRDLTINLDFPNAVEKNAVDYQQMKVTVSGGDLAEAIVIELGDTDTTTAVATEYEKKDAKYVIDVEDGYTVTVTDVLTVNTAYTVTVEGAGYRTYRYTVTMTGDKTLNFWNNVKDNDTVVEKDKKTEKVTYLAGDIVKDSLINVYDLSAVVSYFGETELVGNNDTYAKYDLNRDGKIDSKDVAYVLVSWGK